MAEKDKTPMNRKPYNAPVLTQYGSVEQLTLGTGGSANDLGVGSSRGG